MKWFWFALIGLCACSAETAGKEVQMRWTFAQNAEDSNAAFTTRTGWNVSLDEARIALESVYAYGAAPSSVATNLSRLFVSVAHAHGGHDPISGRPVRAEMLDLQIVDLLDGDPRRLPLQAAEAGPVETVKLLIAPTTAKLPESMHGSQVYVRGSAERDGRRVSFAGGLTLDDSEPARRVERPDLSGDIEEATEITIGVRASTWFQEAEFDRIATDDSDEVVEIARDSQVGRAWAIGARSPDAFDVTLGKD